jgi:hypothetical protein
VIPSSDKYFAKEIAFGKGLKPLVQERFTRIWYEFTSDPHPQPLSLRARGAERGKASIR